MSDRQRTRAARWARAEGDRRRAATCASPQPEGNPERFRAMAEAWGCRAVAAIQRGDDGDGAYWAARRAAAWAGLFLRCGAPAAASDAAPAPQRSATAVTGASPASGRRRMRKGALSTMPCTSDDQR